MRKGGILMLLEKTLLLVLVRPDQASPATWEVPRLGRGILSPPGPAVSEVKVH